MAYSKLLETITTIFILMGTGIFAVKMRILEEKDTQIFSNLIFNITSPALILTSVMEYFNREAVFSSLAVPLFAVFMTAVSLSAAYAAGKIINLRDRAKQDIFSLAVSFCNTIYIGLPIISAVYGEKAAGYVFFYDFGSSVILWTLGVELAGRVTADVRDKSTNSAESADRSLHAMLKNFVNPPLIALVAAVALVMLDIQIPEIIIEPFKILGDITIPLSMLFIGMTVANMNISPEIFEPAVISASLIRLVISPLALGTLVYFTGIPIILKKVITIEAGLPIMMFTAILARKYQKYPEFAAKLVMITTLLSMATIPIMILILEKVY